MRSISKCIVLNIYIIRYTEYFTHSLKHAMINNALTFGKIKHLCQEAHKEKRHLCCKSRSTACLASAGRKQKQ